MKKYVILGLLVIFATQITAFCSRIQLIDRTLEHETRIWVEQENIDLILADLDTHLATASSRTEALAQIYTICRQQRTVLAEIETTNGRILVDQPLHQRKSLAEQQTKLASLLEQLGIVCSKNEELHAVVALSMSRNIPLPDICNVLTCAIVLDPRTGAYFIRYPARAPKAAYLESRRHADNCA